MNQPSVSIVLPVYNGERYLSETLDSILGQSLTDFELLVTDDGSTDSSPEIIRKYAARDSRIRPTFGKNQGSVPVTNQALKIARAPYIVRHDQDDLSTPRRLEMQVAFLNDHPKVVCVGGAADMIDEAGRYLTTLTVPIDNATIQATMLDGHCPICHGAGCYRLDAALAAGAYREPFFLAEDIDLWLRIGEVGEMASLSEPVLRYRLHAKSLSEQFVELQVTRMHRACEEAWERRGIQGSFKAARLWRPTQKRSSRYEFAVMYGWWAFNSRENATAAHYARKAIALMPYRPEGWKLLACAMMKRAPVQ